MTDAPIRDVLIDWADRHRGAAFRAAWIAEATGMPVRTVEGWLGGKRPDADPIIRRFVVAFDELAAARQK